MRSTQTWLFGCLLILATAIASMAIAPQFASAQEDADDEAAAPADFAKAEAPPQVPANGEATHAPTKNRLYWIVESSGFIGLFIFCLSVYFGATLIRLFLDVRKSVLLPDEEIDVCEQMLNERNFQGLYAFASKSKSFFGRLTSAGVAALGGADLDEAREVMDRHAEVETVNLERQISPLAVLGTLGPMIGLVGTLKGMIASFSVIALSDTQMKASEVAGGISEALLLTFEGVALSVPAIYFFSFFRNRVAVISAETLLAADDLVRRVLQQAKHKATPVPIQTVPRAPA